jgi:hypothetical protein
VKRAQAEALSIAGVCRERQRIAPREYKGDPGRLTGLTGRDRVTLHLLHP